MVVKFTDNPREMSWNMEIQKLMQSNEWMAFYLLQRMMPSPPDHVFEGTDPMNFLQRKP